ncbi:glutathione S-transferase [soil metagenome]
MTRPLLYTYRRCPYAMRARMALLQAGIAFDAHEIVLRDKPAAMLAISPKGTVPVLLLPDGRVIDESLEIMRWAFEGRDEAGWWDRANTPANQALIAINDGPFKRHLDRYKYPERYGDTARGFERTMALTCLLNPLQERLCRERYLGGNEPCAADLALFPFVRQFRAVDEAWFDAQPFNEMREWLLGWLMAGQFQVCMTKLKAGFCGPFLPAAPHHRSMDPGSSPG